MSGPRYALEGKIVTMDENNRVLDRGVVYIDAGQIVAVKPLVPVWPCVRA
ncbi:hypothetical protein LCGC14_1368050 [marine sediment metagenome]|uniref:Uncharacterized protein n=1 Tax=marine sediment metagenome TaxID=412755 RepID=A0A0F9K6I6_9ZZZZ